MDQQRPAKRILNAKPEETDEDKNRGGNDVKPLGERNWKNIARNRQIWQNFLRKDMAQKRAILPMIIMIKGTKGVNGPVGYVILKRMR
jgi:hypothetical protein